LYAAGIGLAFVYVVVVDFAYAAVALLWLVPDRQMERALSNDASAGAPRE
jgi:hypothetical protein